MQPDETILSGALSVCPDCVIRLTLEVLQSAAGFCIGTRCECGPYSQESGYFKSVILPPPPFWQAALAVEFMNGLLI